MTDPLRVMAWNLAHQTRHKPIPQTVATVTALLGVDVALYNEFVDGPTRRLFREQLAAHGYKHTLVSVMHGRHNQVLAASRVPISPGDLTGPTFTKPAPSNFLHVSIDNSPIELIGIRIPAYGSKSDKVGYRQQLGAILELAADRTIAVAGDINENPFAAANLPEADNVPYSYAPAFTVANPAGAWSFMRPSGTGTSRVDHVLRSPSALVTDVEFCSEAGGHHLAGPATTNPISDHAALLFTISAR